MSEQLSNEIRNVMEQKNQTLAKKIERSNQALLQALQNMGNSINNLKTHICGGRDISSNHSENSGASPYQVPKPPLLSREGPPMEEEG